jgi:hypothetical protein
MTRKQEEYGAEYGSFSSDDIGRQRKKHKIRKREKKNEEQI